MLEIVNVKSSHESVTLFSRPPNTRFMTKLILFESESYQTPVISNCGLSKLGLIPKILRKNTTFPLSFSLPIQ